MGMDDHHAAAAAGVLRCLQHGTTTVADSGPTGAGAGALRAAGLRGIVHLEAFGRHTGDAAREAAIALAKRVAALDDDRDPRVRIGVSPHAPYTCSDRTSGTCSSTTRTSQIVPGPRIWPNPRMNRKSPVLEPDRSPNCSPRAERSRAGGRARRRLPRPEFDPCRVLRPGLIAAHCVHLDADDPARLAAAGVGVAHCPISNATLACGDAPIARLRDAGVTLGLGTDSPASAGDYDLRADGRAAGPGASRHPLRSSSSRRSGSGARPGQPRRLDRDRETRRPDRGHGSARRRRILYVAALDPTARVSLVLVDGVVLLEDGEPVMLDQGAILARAATSRQRLTQGSGSAQE